MRKNGQLYWNQFRFHVNHKYLWCNASSCHKQNHMQYKIQVFSKNFTYWWPPLVVFSFTMIKHWLIWERGVFPERIAVLFWHCVDQTSHNWVLKIRLEKLQCGQGIYVDCSRAADDSAFRWRRRDHGACASLLCLCWILKFFVSSVMASLYSHTHKCLILNNSSLEHACHPRAWAQKNF